jgi:hypothetical protein
MAIKTLTMPCKTDTGILVSSWVAFKPDLMGIMVIKNPKAAALTMERIISARFVEFNNTLA